MFNAVQHKNRLCCGLLKCNVDLSSVRIVFFACGTYNVRDIFNFTEFENIFEHLMFNLNKSTVLYIHGYRESLESESLRVIVDAYIQRNDHNILLLDWSQLAVGNKLFDTAINIKAIGHRLGKCLKELTFKGYSVEKFHLVGHSMGAHIAGIAGKYFFERTKSYLTRITGLDPALHPFYFYPPIVKHISAYDAAFVDIIHTDVWVHGTPVATGTADFWPNGGKYERSGGFKAIFRYTDEDLEGHRRSWKYWAESVLTNRETSFHAVKCKSWKDFKEKKFETRAIVFMGINCPTNTTGDYYLQTNNEFPFSKGEEGTRYRPNEVLKSKV